MKPNSRRDTGQRSVTYNRGRLPKAEGCALLHDIDNLLHERLLLLTHLNMRPWLHIFFFS
jgi:hypothetical protein